MARTGHSTSAMPDEDRATDIRRLERASASALGCKVFLNTPRFVVQKALSTCRLCDLPGRKQLIQDLRDEFNVTQHLVCEFRAPMGKRIAGLGQPLPKQ